MRFRSREAENLIGLEIIGEIFVGGGDDEDQSMPRDELAQIVRDGLCGSVMQKGGEFVAENDRGCAVADRPADGSRQSGPKLFPVGQVVDTANPKPGLAQSTGGEDFECGGERFARSDRVDDGPMGWKVPASDTASVRRLFRDGREDGGFAASGGSGEQRNRAGRKVDPQPVHDRSGRFAVGNPIRNTNLAEPRRHRDIARLSNEAQCEGSAAADTRRHGYTSSMGAPNNTLTNIAPDGRKINNNQ